MYILTVCGIVLKLYKNGLILHISCDNAFSTIHYIPLRLIIHVDKWYISIPL